MFTAPDHLPTETSDWDQVIPPNVLHIINSLRFWIVVVIGTVPSEHTQPNGPQLFLSCVCLSFLHSLLPLVRVKALSLTGASTVSARLASAHSPNLLFFLRQPPPLPPLMLLWSDSSTPQHLALSHTGAGIWAQDDVIAEEVPDS